MKLFTLLAVAFSGSLGTAQDFIDAVKLGGDTTLMLSAPTAQAFRNPAENLSREDLELHMKGDRLFERKFSDDPSRPDYGLGPAFNHVSCIACHISDGRGALPVLGDGAAWTKLNQTSAIFLRVSVEDGPRSFTAGDNWGAPKPVPGYGTQLFHLGSFGLREDIPGAGQAEVFVRLEWSVFTYPDGTEVRLRRPVFKIENAYNPRLYAADVRSGPRMTPGMTGLGLLEAVRESDILELAARDLSAWGIHGRPNWVIDRAKELAGDARPISLGRFGLKANTPSVFHQSAGALVNDIGVTSSVFPLENIAGSALFEAFRPRWQARIEADDDLVHALVFYSQTLAVPSRRDVNERNVRAGGRLFARVGCANCHHPSFTTGPHEIPELAGQKIHPFTDLLLHDMGEGLADGRTDFHAGGRDWRTRALWGLGLTQVVNPRAGFLHDGRAGTLEEAILWHGGEAEKSKRAFAALPARKRQSLLRFLESL